MMEIPQAIMIHVMVQEIASEFMRVPKHQTAPSRIIHANIEYAKVGYAIYTTLETGPHVIAEWNIHIIPGVFQVHAI